jgi:hypothetical protein
MIFFYINSSKVCSTSNKEIYKYISDASFETSKEPSFKDLFLLVHEIILDFYNMIQMNVFLTVNDLLICSSHSHHSNQ